MALRNDFSFFGFLYVLITRFLLFKICWYKSKERFNLNKRFPGRPIWGAANRAVNAVQINRSRQALLFYFRHAITVQNSPSRFATYCAIFWCYARNHWFLSSHPTLFFKNEGFNGGGGEGIWIPHYSTPISRLPSHIHSWQNILYVGEFSTCMSLTSGRKLLLALYNILQFLRILRYCANALLYWYSRKISAKARKKVSVAHMC